MSADDTLVLVEDGEPAPATARPWRVLVVDDDLDVREATRFNLRGMLIDGRPLQLLEAGSAAQAERLLLGESDVAVLLLDVVMETPDAGLRLVERLRANADWQALRIVLRTGQPGYAPELDVIRRYDINDYKTKSDLTQVRLVTTLTVALRGYQQLRRLDAHQRGLEKVVRASGTLMRERSTFQAFAEGVLTQLCTLVDGEPDGVLLLRRVPDAPGEVMVAAGAFVPWQGQSEAALPPPLQATLQALVGRQVVDVGPFGAVRAHTNDGEDMVVLFSLSGPLDALALQLLELFAVNLSLAYDDLKAYLELQYQARFDRETGLVNRSGLKHTLAGLQGLEVAQLQLGELQEIRGVLGENVARQALRDMAERLRVAVGADGWVARLEGDRFALAVAPERLARVEVALAGLLMQPLSVGGLELHLPVAMGWSASDVSLDQALDEAGLVASRLPAGRQLRAARYAPSLREQVQRRMALLADLPLALAEDRVEMHLQPQVRLTDLQPVGAEALMRLRKPDGQLLGPDFFIPVAEHTGLIVPLGARIVALALTWLQQHPVGRLSVNISLRQLEEPDFAAWLQQAVATAGVPRERLRLEVTESAFALDGVQVGDALAQLAAAGFELSIDDFGTGQSSLGRLAEIQVHELKLDRSLVRGIETDARARRVARLIVELGRDLGVEVLAEGIETEGQLDLLRELGCTLGQGFLFGRAAPP